MMSDMTIMTRAVMPSMTNFRGVLFGGMLMEWMDEVAGIAEKRFAGPEVTTAAVEGMKFLRPIPVGAFIEVAGAVATVGNTSLRVKIDVSMDSQHRGVKGDEKVDKVLVAEALFVYVALDEMGKPRTIEKEISNT